jgi:probable aminopeptidase NPEPL1
MPATLSFDPKPPAIESCETLLFIGRAERLLSEQVKALLPASLNPSAWVDMVKRSSPGDGGRLASSYTGGAPKKVCAGVLPEVCSRHNTASRSWAIPALVRGAGLKGNVGIIVALDHADHGPAAAMGVARAHPSFAGTSKVIERNVHVQLIAPEGPLEALAHCEISARAVRRAQALTDSPTSLVGCSAIVGAAAEVSKRLTGTTCTIVRGEDLVAKGLGGIWAVGKAATDAPALVVLDHDPGDATEHHCWVGKGIVYDTGGLSIKTKTGMPGMKMDMAGSAAVLAAFEAAVSLDCTKRLTAILCVAENAIGPNAIRPDDLVQMFSGKTVEINNTDAEGRLVLADGVAWAAANRKPSVIIDIATLTGAQSVATGKRHAALYCNDEGWEAKAVNAGKRSGDLTHPLPYCPEFFRKEFRSQVADMKNSVKDRGNGQSSCAGQFIGNHLDKYKGTWLHVDMAGPSKEGGRATGYGVGLLLALADVL